MNDQPTQHDLEELSAYYDGELPAERAQLVQARLAGDAAWQRAYRQIQSLDEALEAWRAPAPPAGLDGHIVQGVRTARRTIVVSAARWLAPLAAAAAIVLAVVLLHAPPEAPVDQAAAPAEQQAHPQAAVTSAHVQTVEDFCLENLDFLREMEVLANLDTLEAIEQMEYLGIGS